MNETERLNEFIEFLKVKFVRISKKLGIFQPEELEKEFDAFMVEEEDTGEATTEPTELHPAMEEKIEEAKKDE